MKITLKSDKTESTKTELLIIGQYEKEKFSHLNIDKKLKGIIAKAIKEKKFEGEFRQTYSVSSLGNLKSDKIVIVGLGEKKEFTKERLRRIAGFTAKIARDCKIKSYTTNLARTDIKLSTTEKIQTIVEGTIMALYDFNRYKTQNKDKVSEVTEVVLLTDDMVSANKGVSRGKILAETTNYVRDLVNIPPSEATPTYLAKEAKAAGKKEKIKVTVFGKKELQKHKMNAILGVSRGSIQEPKLIILETNPNAKHKVAIVGKGITFDSGGLDLKPPRYMLEMKSDMAGSAAVLGTVIAAKKLKLSINIIGIMAASENMPGQDAQKPGDIIKAYNKKTIEIIDTDAEGRLVLADAVAYAETKKPEAIIDIATLTGACVVVLGYAAAALISNNDSLKEAIKKAADNTHERVWELPLWDDFRELVKSDIADVRNIGKGKGYEAGTITAATFIEAFVEKTPWAHLDIAGTAWFAEGNDYIPKDGTGYGVRLLIDLLENWKPPKKN